MSIKNIPINKPNEQWKSSNMKIICNNNKASHNYFIVESIVAGVQLLPTEVKSIVNNHVSISEAFVEITNGEVFLINSHVSQYEVAAKHNPHDPYRKRKLLLTKKQIRHLSEETERSNLTIVPTNICYVNNKIKITIAIAKGKKNYDKRDSEKLKEINKFIKSKVDR